MGTLTSALAPNNTICTWILEWTCWRAPPSTAGAYPSIAGCRAPAACKCAGAQDAFPLARCATICRASKGATHQADRPAPQTLRWRISRGHRPVTTTEDPVRFRSARGGTRTPTPRQRKRILSPLRLPIPPPGLNWKYAPTGKVIQDPGHCPTIGAGRCFLDRRSTSG